MRIKAGVKMVDMEPQAVLAVVVADNVYSEHGLDMVITSINDGSHSASSLHYEGCAVDLRLPSRCGGDAEPFDLAFDQKVTNEIKERLGGQYDVILETHQANRYEHHIHIEYDER